MNVKVGVHTSIITITNDREISHGRWFSQCTPASSTTETGRHDIAEILLKVAFNTKNQIKSNHATASHDYIDKNRDYK
jgi:hypothetical protein